MNLKESEESKRKKVLGPQEEWILIQSAITHAEKNMKLEHRKPQIQMALKAKSTLASDYLLLP